MTEREILDVVQKELDSLNTELDLILLDYKTTPLNYIECKSKKELVVYLINYLNSIFSQEINLEDTEEVKPLTNELDIADQIDDIK